MSIAAAAAYSERWAQFLLYPLAFIEACIIGSPAHQAAFEIATVGHLTPDFDSCSTALMPLVFIFLLAVSFIAPAPLMLLFPKLRAARNGMQPPNPLDTRSGRIWLAAGVTAGAAFGFVAWHDWQIDQSCL